ncbi:MAG: beta-glycosidase [Muribaculaceae bacterium]|nr:beta-glycosidase [Muribaculaceae bacterium]
MKPQVLLNCVLLAIPVSITAQTAELVTTTQDYIWKHSKASLHKSPDSKIIVKAGEAGFPSFRDWGMTFNELDHLALSKTDESAQKEILYNLFSPEGDMRFSRGRISPGANDYAESWYSCDEVRGDLDLKYFNIERDKKRIIPFIKAAQELQPALTFWISPWSPPSWMKINGDYPVVSSRYNNLTDSISYLLFGDGDIDEDEMKLTGPRDKQFPRQLATNDFFIQDPRYLKAYANYFCKFIDAYREQNIPIDMVIYQNEAYSYTPYPGCAWTAEGTIRFNRDYLAPALKKSHPDVELFMGTFNTNRLDHVEKVLSDPELNSNVAGVAIQWEGRDVLPEIRKQHPEWRYMGSESECGWGSFDWKAAEHTFELINHYLGNGCDEYTFWNVILCDSGESPWGWKQNALIRVDSKDGSYTYTPEYQAVRHYTSFLGKGSVVNGYKEGKSDGLPVLTAIDSNGRQLVFAGNFTDAPQRISVKIGNRYLNLKLKPHSFTSCKI